jgi:hypothetical protein
MTMPRMRTIKEAIREIKAQDPGTAITEHYLRVLINNGRIPVSECGNKYLVSMEDIADYFKNENEEGPLRREVG